MSLDTQFINLNPLTLDGLTTIQADNLNLNVDAGLLQADSFGDVYGSTNISFEPSIQGVTMTNFIRNAITGSTFVDYDKNTGIISLSGGVASKWTLDITGNILYPAVAVTGIVAVESLVVSGAATMNNGLYVSGNVSTFKSTSGNAMYVAGYDNTSAGYDLRGAFRVVEGTPTQSTTGGLEIPQVVASIQRFGRGGVVNGASMDFRLSSYEKAATQSRTQCDIHLHNNFYADAPTRVMTLRGNGNVGIGNNAPNSTLTVSGNMGLSGAMTISGSLNVSGAMSVTGNVTFNNSVYVNTNLQVGGDASANRVFVSNARLTSNSNDLFINAGTTNQTIHIRPNGDGSTVGQSTFNPTATALQGNSLNIDSVGNVGIGTTSPVVKLHIVTGAQTIAELLRMTNGTSTLYSGIDNSNGPWFGTSSSHSLRFVTNGTARMTIDTAGNVGIGATPNYKLHVKGDALFIEPTTTANPAQIILNVDTATNKFGSIDYLTNGDMKISNNFTTGKLISTNDISLPKGSTTGRKISFDYGSTNAGATDQGILWTDLTTSSGQLAIYGFQNTLNFVAGGSQKMTIGANVDFNSPPYVAGSQIDTNDVLEGTNLYYTDTRFDNRFATKTTTNLTEGTNLYFTTARARQSISASAPLSYVPSTGVMSLENYSYEWRGQANTGTGDKYIFVARLPSDGGCGVQIRGVVGGFFRNETSKIDIAINVRGADSVYGSMETESSTFADVISFMDFVLYTNGTSRDLYIVLKSGKWYSYDFVINGQVDCILYTPTITTVTPTGTVSIASILSVLRVYTIAGQVNIGTAVAETNTPLRAFKASGGIKIKAQTNNASDAEFIAQNTTSHFSVYSHNSVNSLRVYNYGSGLVGDLFTIQGSNGNVGIGNMSPQFKLSVSANTDTTAHIKSNSTTGYAQIFLQGDGLVGGGLVLYGSAHASSNALSLQNLEGNIYINPVSFATVNGNCGIGGDPVSSLCVRGSTLRTDNNIAGVHMAYNSNTPNITLVSETSNEIGTINFGYKGTLTTNGTILYDHYANSMRFLTNGNTRMTITGNGRVHINSSSQLSTYAGDMLNVKGRVLIAGYDGSDNNPVLTFKDSANAFHYFYYSGSGVGSGFYLTDYLGIGKQPVYQIDLSTDYARKLTSIYWSVVSDRRLKENIEDANLDICYENIKKLKLHRYNYIEEFGKNENGVKQYGDNRQLGWIAQEAIEVFPKSVKITNNTENGGLEDEMALDADQIMKSLYGAVQKLMNKVENLEETIIKERIQYKAMKQKQDALITKQGVLIDCMKKALLMRGITI